MNSVLKIALAAGAMAVATQAAAEVVFYEHDGFNGRQFSAEGSVGDLQRNGFNDLASSVVVLRDRWEVCEDSQFRGRCVVLRPGRYPSLNALGLNDRVSSARIVGRNVNVDDRRYAPPPPMPVYDNYRRGGERIYNADVTSVRAVVGPSDQRCWVEREQVSDRGSPNVGGAVLGGILGGVLGHQIGSGRGNDVATAGGAVAGAVIGANAGRDDRGGRYQDVQRCTNTQSNARPEFWDVTYNFRGTEHRVQMASPPGPTIPVNEAGEPRS
jgi:uncharacterized protein YcfJ